MSILKHTWQTLVSVSFIKKWGIYFFNWGGGVFFFKLPPPQVSNFYLGKTYLQFKFVAVVIFGIIIVNFENPPSPIKNNNGMPFEGTLFFQKV